MKGQTGNHENNIKLISIKNGERMETKYLGAE